MKKILAHGAVLACFAPYSTHGQEAAQGNTIISPSTISCFLVTDKENASLEKGARIAQTPGKLVHTLVKETLRRAVPGIWAVYGGMCTFSDYQGQIRFPRRNIDEEITLLITQKIKPIILSGSTVHRFVVAEGAPYALYTFSRKSVRDTFFWEITEQELPPNKSFSPFALVLFAKPEEIRIPTDIIVTHGSPNLLLPTLRVARSANLTLNTLLFFKVNQFFAPVVRSYRFTDDRFATLLMPE